MAPKTNEIQKILKNNKEIVLWNNTKDLVSKIKFLLKNQNVLKKISIAGYLKIMKGNHSENDRAKQILTS